MKALKGAVMCCPILHITLMHQGITPVETQPHGCWVLILMECARQYKDARNVAAALKIQFPLDNTAQCSDTTPLALLSNTTLLWTKETSEPTSWAYWSAWEVSCSGMIRALLVSSFLAHFPLPRCHDRLVEETTNLSNSQHRRCHHTSLVQRVFSISRL